jgi:hypothetical protein
VRNERRELIHAVTNAKEQLRGLRHVSLIDRGGLTRKRSPHMSDILTKPKSDAEQKTRRDNDQKQKVIKLVWYWIGLFLRSRFILGFADTTPLCAVEKMVAASKDELTL